MALGQQIQHPSAFVNSLGMKLLWIKPGKFTMGSPANEWGRGANEVQHEVRLSKGFFIADKQVTQEQWEVVMGKNPSASKGSQRPVERVRWERAVEFCDALSEAENKKPLFSLSGLFRKKTAIRKYRLPTEAEWEYACRAGTAYPFHYGRTIATTQVNFNGAAYGEAGRKGEPRGSTTDVGFFKPNDWGLYDMHGNVFEWCSDNFGPYEIKSDGSTTDPTGAGMGDLKVARGGSYQSKPEACRSAARHAFRPMDRLNDVGIRVVVEMIEE